MMAVFPLPLHPGLCPQVEHDVKTGKIRGADGIRGFGIAFPEAVVDPSGRGESAVGMWKVRGR